MNAYIVEDYDAMRIILKRLLKKNFSEISGIGESETAEKALEEIPACRPDIVLVDISLPGMNGIDLIKKLKVTCVTICILVVTAHDVEVYRQAALDAGAHDIVSKTDYKTLLQVIDKIIEDRLRGRCL